MNPQWTTGAITRDVFAYEVFKVEQREYLNKNTLTGVQDLVERYKTSPELKFSGPAELDLLVNAYGRLSIYPTPNAGGLQNEQKMLSQTGRFMNLIDKVEYIKVGKDELGDFYSSPEWLDANPLDGED